jgi:hypothetical protein
LTAELDQELGDIHNVIKGVSFAVHGIDVDRELEIMQRMRDVVMESVPMLLQMSHILAELDWYLCPDVL